jgi:hypothetical protein
MNERTAVEVLCVDRLELVNERQRRRIDQIAVYDNASGMDAVTLRDALQFGNGTHLDRSRQEGIGKFGMGLPNASISQCKRIDVYTWQKGKVLHTHLDVDQIEKGKLKEVPAPEPTEIPETWRLVNTRAKENRCRCSPIWRPAPPRARSAPGRSGRCAGGCRSRPCRRAGRGTPSANRMTSFTSEAGCDRGPVSGPALPAAPQNLVRRQGRRTGSPGLRSSRSSLW